MHILLTKLKFKTMEKKIFKVGDKVFDIRFGWGDVKDVANEEVFIPEYPIHVQFNKVTNCIYTNDGKFLTSDLIPMLSFTEYAMEGFSQERPIDFNDYKGKWGIFWDGESITKTNILSVLRDCRINNEYKFMCNDGIWFTKFKPLSEEMVKELGLDVLKD